MRVGTRRSALAVAQAGAVADALGSDAELVPIATADAAVGDKERFVAAIDRALLEGDIDIAVHSAKDLPGERPDGLALVGVPNRADPADSFCGRAGSLAEIPEGGAVGTASLRRRAQLLAARPDLEVTELRGNVDTRLRLTDERGLVGCVLARAGLERLGRTGVIGFDFTPLAMTPAPGQGCLALEAREGDEQASELARSLTDPTALVELTAERAAAAALGADCETAVGIRATLTASGLVVEGFAGMPDGERWVRDQVEGGPDQPGELGRALGERMLAAGGAEILEAARATPQTSRRTEAGEP
ncbi:hydroxymethylbilane synthase [Thermoleophilia bacterium SCSIO 60948]|nr:hydroxymethylbilane synthase [Thermoleophilia bacterium SCSIO 60948]